MIDVNAYSVNLKKMKRYNYFYDRLAYNFILCIVGSIIAGIVYFFPTLMTGTVGAFLLQMILSSCCAISGYLAMYKKVNFYAPIGLLLGTVGLVIKSNDMGQMINVICVFDSLFAIVPIFILNSKYHYLEQQEGFPNFSVLLTENMEKADNALNSDAYAKDPIYFKNLSGEMDNIVMPDKLMDKKEISPNNYMDSV